MKASETRLLDLLKQGHQFVIPIYQRAYSWTDSECDQLIGDIERAGGDALLKSHFTGSIVYVEKGLANLTTQEPHLIIDGQQRMTTVMLLIAALAEVLEEQPEGQQEPAAGYSPRKLRNRYLVNSDEDGEDHFKLLLTEKDRETLKAIIGRTPLPSDFSERVHQNFHRFRERLGQPGTDLAAVCDGLAKLVVVDIRLDRSTDNPQLIFESMNSTGRKLSQADLIRNFILMGQETATQEKLYSTYWRPMEKDFGQSTYEDQFDDFVRHYLTVVTGEIPRLRDVYEAYKAYAGSFGSGGDIEDLVRELHSYARRYCAVALGHERGSDLAEAFRDLREIKADVVYPLLLELYTDYEDGVLSRSELVEIVEMVTSYIFRRAVCRVPTNSLNRTFSTFTKSVDKKHYVDSVGAHLLGLKSYRAFPTDGEFAKALVQGDMYNFQRRSYLFRRLENVNRKERVPIEDYTIEHILPQNQNLSQRWREDLGESWARVQERYLHTLGNLTLTGYNSEYGDRPFVEKRDMPGGFRESPLRLNSGLGALDTWNESAIVDRAERLAGEALGVWPRPAGPAVVPNSTPATTASGYSLADHPHLGSPRMRSLFESFRGQALGLDPAVTETILKSYIAYKAETNFVDVIAQSGRLKLTLNMPFEALHDERDLAWDVTGKGTNGNGNVQVALASEGELSYVMGLVRQSYEFQVGE